MKPRFIALACVIVLVLLRAPARAATELWQFSGTNPIFMVMADGKGGCAIARANIFTDFGGDIVWLDQNGAVRYQAALTNIIAGGVIGCSDKNLLYADLRESSTNTVVVAVDSTGAATVLPAPPGTANRMPGQFPFSHQRMDDKTGFFAVRILTNGMTYSVVRFSNK